MNHMLATLTTDVTRAVADHGAYAVFLLMALDTVLPLGGELTMLYAGVLAAGAAGAQLTVLGGHVASGIESYAVLVAAGTLGSLAGGVIAYGVGAWGGRALIDERARWLRMSPETFARAHAWMERHGRAAIFLGRVTPVVRSFTSIPAGVLRIGFGDFALFTLLGSVVWCTVFAAAGWGLAASWESVHRGFGYVEYAVVAAALVVAAAVLARRRRASRRRSGAVRPAA
jgi:membrane protein DedA with SNARE-associated domain